MSTTGIVRPRVAATCTDPVRDMDWAAGEPAASHTSAGPGRETRIACAAPDVDPDMFYPAKGERPNRAKAVCATCSVRAACLEYALATKQGDGIWGGKTVRERNLIRRHRENADPHAGESAGRTLDRVAS